MNVKIGDKEVGNGQPVFVVAEIGINHNGKVSIAKELISVAKEIGCDAVKFQKRTVDVVYSPEELAKPRESPFGKTNGDLKRGLELSMEDYDEIDRFCKGLEIQWFASCWDRDSVDLINSLSVPCFKIASASLTDLDLLAYTRGKGKPIILSTGMSTSQQVNKAVEILGKDDLVILHTCSTYPSEFEELNLKVIWTLRWDFPSMPIGYSGHERGIVPSIAAVALGARMIERHITLDRGMWGSDQAASLEPQEFKALVEGIRIVEKSLGDGIKKVEEREKPIIEKLRRVK